jgi:tartrate dehydratase alpha subunit/fumarate hydratase class I-like protein
VGKAKRVHRSSDWIKMVAMAQTRLCPPYAAAFVIASAAKQSRDKKEAWIASSQGLLAMTENRQTF